MIYSKILSVFSDEAGIWLHCDIYPLISGIVKPGLKAKCYCSEMKEKGTFFISSIKAVKDEVNNISVNLLLRGIEKNQTKDFDFILIYDPCKLMYFPGGKYNRPIPYSTLEISIRPLQFSIYPVLWEFWEQFEKFTGREVDAAHRQNRLSFQSVNHVSWYDAVEFCNFFSEQKNCMPFYEIDKNTLDPNNRNKNDTLRWTVTINPDSDGYRLPTAAEWEYCCYYYNETAQDSPAIYDMQNSLTQIDFISNDLLGKLHLIPTSQGIYGTKDLYNWCYDWYHARYYEMCPGNNPSGPESGNNKVIQGKFAPEKFTYFKRADLRRNNISFRMVKNIPEPL